MYNHYGFHEVCRRMRRLAAAILILLQFIPAGVMAQAASNLIGNGDFEQVSEPVWMDAYYKALIKRGWDFQRHGPMVEMCPVWLPNAGAAKVRQLAEEGNGRKNICLYVRTEKDPTDFYRGMGKPFTTYRLTLRAKGQGMVSFSTYYVSPAPVFLKSN